MDRKEVVSPEKIHLFARFCFHSNASEKKQRPSYFDRELCYRNLLNSIDQENVRLTFILDTFYQKEGQKHFLDDEKKHPVIRIQEGTEAKSFLFMLDYVKTLDLDPETILYFIEDDYVHKKGWIQILKEGFTIDKADYITLYDHNDKYFGQDYFSLKSKLFLTPSSHWRTTPSTTNTYAMKWKTLKKHFSVHRGYSENVSISKDHEKFLALHKMGANLISPIPGWSTHLEVPYLSPCINWQKILLQTANSIY